MTDSWIKQAAQRIGGPIPPLEQWNPDITEYYEKKLAHIEQIIASEYSKSERCPECDSSDRNSHNLISHGALVPCDDTWHSKSGDAPAPAANTTTSTTQSDAIGQYDSAKAQRSLSDGNVVQLGKLEAAQLVGGRDAPAGTTPDAELRRLRDWKSSAMKQLAKSEALMKVLPAKYLGWDVYEAAIDFIKSAARASSAPPDGWVSVEERLPEVGGTYDVYEKFSEPFHFCVDVGHFFKLESGPNWMNSHSQPITVSHWRERPSPPAGQGGKL